MKKTLLSLTIASTLFATNAINLGIGGGRNYVDNSPLQNYNFLNIRIGKYLTQNSLLRLEYEQSSKVLDNNSLQRALLNYEYDFHKKSLFTPYVFIGGGYQIVNGKYPNNFIGDTGIGTKIEMKQHIDLFAELRALKDFKDNDFHYGGLFGIEYKFGNEEPKKIISPIHKVADSDNDGIADNLDECPNTPDGVAVDENGCPIDSDNDGVADYLDKCPNTPYGVAVDENGCPIDSDNDGVADYLDKCPNTPNGVAVDENGCPIDSDNDGVADYLDKCPNTPQGISVNSNGCPISFNFDIEFPLNSTKIEAQFMPKIEKFADFLKSNPGYKVEIQGYTDNIGNKSYNMLLSQKRAKSVYEQLIKLGIDKKRLTWIGYGDKNPIAPNTTKEGRKQNRRVIAKLYFL